MRRSRPALFAVVGLLAIVSAACASGAAPASLAPSTPPPPSSSASASPSPPSPSPSPSRTAAPSRTATATATAEPTAAPPSAAAPSVAAANVTSPEEAAQLLISRNPLFAGFTPQDPNMIGQCCWYEATEVADGYQVTFHAGWGDCPSGCINQHEWTFTVSPTGSVELTEESGDPIPVGGIPAG